MNKLTKIYKVLIICHFVLLQVSVTWSKGKTRIVGGIPTTINQAKFMVQLHNNGQFRCGGSLISKQYVLTAAHCIYNLNPANITIKGGASTLLDYGIISTISKIKMSATYNPSNLHMDYALLKLRTPMEGPLVQPIGICNQPIKPGNYVQVFGFGKRTENATTASNQLYKAYLQVIRWDICAYLNRNVSVVTGSMFCARANGQDACTGDSGGPAVVNGTLCGITSWGYGCGRPNYPGAFTDLYKLHDFILRSIQD